MAVECVRGLVLREIPAGETNKQLVVLARERGRLLLSARGARQSNSKLLAVAQPFVYADFFVYPGRGFLSITQGETLESFYGLRADLKKLGAAAYLAELTEAALPEDLEADAVLTLLLTALAVLARTEFPPLLTVHIFELKLLELSGFLSEAEELAVEFSLSEGAARAVAYIEAQEGAALFRFGVSPAVLTELGELAAALLDRQIPGQRKSLDFLRRLD